MASVVGITGGIGSGKSTICGVFKLLGIPVFNADVEAKKLMERDLVLINKLVQLFGKGIYTENKKLNRKKLANIIFNDNAQLKKINEIVHPAVRSSFKEWKEQQEAPYLIHEAAILFESGLDKLMDFTILVSAPEEMRIKRVCKRDGVRIEQVKERINKQWNDVQKRALATLEIKNDNKELIIPQVIKIDKQLKENGKIW